MHLSIPSVVPIMKHVGFKKIESVVPIMNYLGFKKTENE
jgi:hypothetical protein